MRELRSHLLLAMIILAAGAVGIAQEVDRPGPTGTIRFPDVEGWERSQVYRYPLEELGYSVNYESTVGGKVTLYVYDKNLKSIPDGIEGMLFKDELKDAKNQIMKAVELRYYESADILKDDSITLGGENGNVQALRMVIRLKTGGKNLTSEIYIFGYDNDFIKLRATRAEEIEGLQNRAITDLFAALDKLFTK
ncbi:MAG: hypothetical protein OEQ28_16610, partial [Acidobacteriota bacterium]|nr:hypothetical protein [Acidobacteriota bacterium]